jgi:hypothetical protein
MKSGWCFWGNVRREFIQRLFAALHGTLGSYLCDALHEGIAHAEACLHVPRVYIFSFFLLFAWWLMLLFLVRKMFNLLYLLHVLRDTRHKRYLAAFAHLPVPHDTRTTNYGDVQTKSARNEHQPQPLLKRIGVKSATLARKKS